MTAREAVRLKFTHVDSEKPPTTKNAAWCDGIMSGDGSRCEQTWREHVQGFKFCRRHAAAARAWVAKTSLDGKEPQS